MTLSASVIRMPKRFDYSSHREFNNAVAAALELGGDVTLDCIEMEYVDSAGIGLLVMSHKKMQANHAKLIMKNVKPEPREILDFANIQKIIDII